MLVAGVAGLVVTLAALRPGAGGERVAIAVHDLEAGTALADRDVRFERVSAPDVVTGAYVTARELAGLRGRVLTVPVFAGEPVLEAHVRTRAATDGRRAMPLLSAVAGAFKTTFVSASASQHSRARTVTLMPPVTAEWPCGLTRWLTRSPHQSRSVKQGDDVARAASES